MRVFAGAALFAALCLCLCASTLGATQAQHTLTAASRRSLTITIYQDFGVVRDVRSVPLSAGSNKVYFQDVSPKIDTETAYFTDEASSEPVWVDAVRYDADTIGANALYQASVGHTVLVITTDPKTGREIGRQTATLLSTDGPVLLFRDRIENGVPPNAHIAYRTIPKDFVLKPALVTDFGTAVAETPRLALNYVSDGFGWTTDYVCELDDAVDKMDVEAVATLSNTSGLTFDDARVRLVSGSVQRAQTQARTFMPKVVSDVYATAAASVMSTYNPNNRATRSSLLEYYQYDVPKPVDLTDNLPVQVALFAAEAVPVDETFETSVDFSRALTGATSDAVEHPIEVYLQFVNSGRQLGIPLPEGVMHLYKRVPAGDVEFVGENSIARTPKNATVKLDLGQSYDLGFKQAQTGYREVQPTQQQPLTFHYSDFRVTLTNAKHKTAAVILTEQMSDDWEIYRENYKHVTLSPESVQWVIPVPPDGTAVLDYSVLQRS